MNSNFEMSKRSVSHAAAAARPTQKSDTEPTASSTPTLTQTGSSQQSKTSDGDSALRGSKILKKQASDVLTRLKKRPNNNMTDSDMSAELTW
jgi:hypothetical protein